MENKSYKIGIIGEEIACKYLRNKGFEIIERNFHSKRGEIDIIAKDIDVVVFAEVKYYSFKSFFLPNYSISKSKKKAIIYTARYYLFKNKLNNILCRFDVLAIYKNNANQTTIQHFINAFDVTN